MMVFEENLDIPDPVWLRITDWMLLIIAPAMIISTHLILNNVNL